MPTLGQGLGVSFQAGFGPDPLALDYFSRMASAGASLSEPRKLAYDAFFKAGRAHGWLQHVIEAYSFEGSTVTQAAVKLIYRTGDPANLVNSGYVNSDVRSGGGMLGAVAGRKFTTINSDTLTNIGGLNMWLRDAVYGVNSIGIGLPNSGTPYFLLSAIYQAPPFNYNQPYSIWGGGGNSITSPPGGNSYSIGRGLYRLQRTALNAMALIINKGTVDTNTGTIADTRRSAAITVAESPLPMDFGMIDDGQMTNAEAEAFVDDLSTLMISLGRLPLSQDINYGVILGQSLATGSTGTPSLSTAPVSDYNNRMPLVILPNSDPRLTSLPPFTFGPLFEPTTETIASEMANTNSQLRRAASPGSASHDLTLSNWGYGGANYQFLKKGTSRYSNTINAISEAKTLAAITHRGSFRVPAVFVVHGESDIGSSTYQADIETWQSDYETDIKAITGQTGNIPMLHSQPSSWSTTALSPFAILDAHVANPTKTVLVCPKYFLPYSDGLHLTNAGYRLLGAYYGKALYAVMSGAGFTPLRPVSAVRSGNVITLTVTGRVGSLVLDTTSVSDPGNYGFEVTGGGSITAVAIVGNTVEITVSGTTTRLRYAYTGPGSPNMGGPTTGPRGCLRDSDTTVGYSGASLPNWMVHFDMAVS